ncbi:hypothetical protein IP88_04985 [alpha proteobacterium AAP81b]|nr:hypothetical protein IP88_04985 [alpha proteobacterium AAP81b]
MALLLAAAPALAAPPVPQFAIAVPPGGQPHIGLRIKRADVDVRLALSYDTALILNSPAAARAGLKAFPLLGKRTFKNAFIPGGAATFRFNLYDITPVGLPEAGVPAVWVDKPIAADGDGVLSITALKAERLVFQLGPTAPGSKTYTLTRPDRGAVAMRAKLGDETIDVMFELNSPDTVMNARAAAALLNAGLVKRSGTVGAWRPFPGVALPFERLTPQPGAKLLGLPLARPGVRIDEATARRLDAAAKAGTSTAEDDADTITVTAARKKGRDPWILIGRDVLGQCSRIVFDRPGKVWILDCNF